MTSETTYLSFVPGVKLPEIKNNEDLWFIYYENKLLVEKTNDILSIPIWSKLKDLSVEFTRVHYLGSLDNVPCYCSELATDMQLPTGMEFKELRPASALLPHNLFVVAGKAIQVIEWDKTHQFCGRCGSKTRPMEAERAKECPECGLLNYPRISPAIIVAIKKDNKILLAHNKRFINNMYSVIAGFVEPGETFEECVQREVFEEVGLQVKNIKYFHSQPWPFPNSMMIGFTADYADGEIKVDGIEIDRAAWFSVEELPSIPSKVSIAGKLINAFIDDNKGK
jgi:NAD+ diphosphatase